MKNVKAVALFKKTDFPRVELINFTVNTTEGNIINYPALYGPYYDFNELYKALLETLKNNNRYVKSWKEFNTTCHDIMFIDVNNPGTTNHYYYNAEV